MSNLDSMYQDLNNNIDSYNDMVYFSNNYIYADNALVDAYNSMLDIYQLSRFFAIDGRGADNNAIIKQHEKILDLINNIRNETNQMQYSMRNQLQNIRDQESRIEAERARQS